MKPFEMLTHHGQIRRLRQLAVLVLADYKIRDFRMKLLYHAYNTTFRVDTATGERFVLRIHRQAHRIAEPVNSELTWLLALRHETTLIVPEPVANRDGELLTVAQIEGLPAPRICVLFRWIEGRFVNAGLTPAHLEQVGRFMAHLHLHSAQFTLPKGFVRPRTDPIMGETRSREIGGISQTQARQQVDNPADEKGAIQLVTESYSLEDGKRVESLIQLMRDIQRTLGHGPEVFGLIHADFHRENYLFHRGQVCAIDFDDCGFGHYLSDMAVTLYNVNWQEDTPALQAAFLAGYRSVRSLSPTHEAYLDTLIMFRDLQLMMWRIEMQDHPDFRDRWASECQEILDDLKIFIEKNPI